MSQTPRWTIAVPTFNGAAYLAETLRSVMTQTDQDFELIVCDDGSKDETLAIISETCGDRAVVELNRTGRTLGLAGNWNRCVEKAAGDWVTILHQDDLLKPGFLAEHRRIARLNPELGLIAGPAPLIDPAGNVISESDTDGFFWPDRLTFLPAKALSRVLVSGNPLRCPATSFRRDLHRDVGGFDASWKYVVDWDFWHRLGQLSPVALVGNPLALQRWHVSSETQRLARGTIDLEENSRLMRRILAGEPFSEHERPMIERKIRRRMSHAWLVRACQAARRGDRPAVRQALGQALHEHSMTVLKEVVGNPRTFARLICGLAKSRTDVQTVNLINDVSEKVG